MERFIRDKYEHKRYITVENGGLGGQAASRHPSSRLTSQPKTGPLGPRPAQSTSTSYAVGYDTTPSTRRTGPSSMSYGGRFSRPVKPTNESLRGSRTGTSLASGNSTGGHLANAMQRASTLKQLLAMGFPQDIAVRAVGIANGDLQKSLDWILQQGSTVQNTTTHAGPPQQANKDLLDFDEAPASASSSAPKATAPKVMETEALIPSTREANPKPATNDFTDFADFGDFQRALPSTPHGKSPTPATKDSSAGVTKNPILASSLADLYKKSPPKPAISSNVGKTPNPQLSASPISHKSSPHSAPKPSSSQRGEDLGLTTFESLSPKNLHLPARSFPPINLASPSGNVHVEAKTASGKKGTLPPPPPPQTNLYPCTADNPPPTPPPPKDDTSSSPEDGTSATVHDSEQEKPIPKSNGNQETNGGHEESHQDNTATTKEEAEEEDPFAALSMMALTSATLAQKRKKDKSVPTLSKGNAPALANAEGAQNDFNLDELLS